MHDEQHRSQFGSRFLEFFLDVLWNQTYHAALEETELGPVEIVGTVVTLGRW